MHQKTIIYVGFQRYRFMSCSATELTTSGRSLGDKLKNFYIFSLIGSDYFSADYLFTNTLFSLKHLFSLTNPTFLFGEKTRKKNANRTVCRTAGKDKGKLVGKIVSPFGDQCQLIYLIIDGFTSVFNRHPETQKPLFR